MSLSIRIIGIGSPFGEDTIGWRIIQSLRESRRLKPFLGNQLELVTCDRPGVQLLSEMEDVDRVILVDALMSGGQVGQVRVFNSEEVAADIPLTSSHGFGVAQALRLGYVLGQLPSDVVVIGVEIGQSGSSEITSIVQKGQAVTEAKVLEWLKV